MARDSSYGHRVDCSLGLALPRRTLTLVSGFFAVVGSLPRARCSWMHITTPMGGSPFCPQGPGAREHDQDPEMRCLGVGMRMGWEGPGRASGS